MIIMIDSNVILDILMKRDIYYENSRKAVNICINENYSVYVSASSITDIYFIMRKDLNDKKAALNNLKEILKIIDILDVKSGDIHSALSSDIADFEDSVLCSIAERNNCDYIMPRNTKDFKLSKVPAITPKDFLNIQ